MVQHITLVLDCVLTCFRGRMVQHISLVLDWPTDDRVIEHLPQELRDRFTEMREMDLSVQTKLAPGTDVDRKSYGQTSYSGTDMAKKSYTNSQTSSSGSKLGQKELGENPAVKEKSKTHDIRNKKCTAWFTCFMIPAVIPLSLSAAMPSSIIDSMDSVEKRVKTFFSNAKKMKPNEKDNEYEDIRKVYYKTLEDADEKVHLANQMHDLVERYLRRLDQELHKFKMELEADHSGITQVLEKRSLDLDQPTQNSSQKENRYSFTRSTYHEKRRDSNSSVTSLEKRLAVEKPLPAPVVEPRPLSAGSGPIQPPSSSSSCAIAPPIPTTNMSYTLGHIGAGGTAIAAAASQAIAATQQMQQGRRTASLKASYEAINIGVHAHEFSIGKELAGAAQTALATIQESSKKQKKKSTNSCVSVVPGSVTSAGGSLSVVTPIPTIVPAPPSPLPPPQLQVPVEPPPVVATDPVAPTPATDPTSAEWTEDDPNDPRYCICNQVSYGDMVACDNEDCPYEWFHYPCVGILAPPKGKWFCPQCTSSMKRRGSRKN
uniref:Inhibitor of growth protein n=1 Tax=Timema tahoe TaxID=61484 RepID=A0A7R9IL04_9NEOP|nr:unnamed protein product [Timema tahoe]